MMNRLPFDIDTAAAGAQIITRDGRGVQLLEYRPTLHESVRVRCLINGSRNPITYFTNGYRTLEKNTKYDLFLVR